VDAGLCVQCGGFNDRRGEFKTCTACSDWGKYRDGLKRKAKRARVTTG